MKTKLAKSQYTPNAADLETVLALTRGGTLAGAAERLGVDASTVFRNLQRIERGLGRSLFERTRGGMRASEIAAQWAEQAEQVESALEAARSALVSSAAQVSGRVRITTTDAVLHALLEPALAKIAREHPLLGFELHTGNELANLTRRDADIAVRATKRPAPHLIGRCLGAIRVAVYAAKRGPIRTLADATDARADWVSPDDALPEHPSVLWRKRRFPKIQPRWRVSSILMVEQFIARGLAVGVLPLFLADRRRAELRALSEPLDEAETELWVLMHAEARHLRRVAAVYAALGEGVRLP